MQATANTTTRQFGFNRFSTTLMTLGLTAAIAIGAVSAAITDNFPSIGNNEQAIVLTKAHTSANQGEGMVGGIAAVSAAVRAHTDERQGEGILGGNMAVTARPQAHTSRDQGDGIVGGNVAVADVPVAHPSIAGGEGIVGGLGSAAVLTPAVKDYDSAGMGNGWVANGQPEDTLKAYAPDGMGNGWIGYGR